MATISFRNGKFVGRCLFDERHIFRDHGFLWSAEKKYWYTINPETASQLRDFCDDSANNEIEKRIITITPWPGSVSAPPIEATPRHFQIDAVNFILARNRSYIAADPGSGKTIIAALAMYNLKGKALFICPPFAIHTMRAEFEKWCPGMIVKFVDPIYDFDADILIMKDNLLLDNHLTQALFDHFNQIENSIAFIDEAHRFKEAEALRTIGIFGGAKKRGQKQKEKIQVPVPSIEYPELTRAFKRVAALSGTPMPNRPIELFPITKALAWDAISFLTYFEYGIRWCKGFKSKFGWDFTGASNVDDLFNRLKKKFMLRIKKSDVLKEIPPVVEQIFILEADVTLNLAKQNVALLRMFDEEKPNFGLETDSLATYRRQCGEQKVIPVCKYLHEILLDTEDKILIFAVHTEVIRRLTERLHKYNPLVITGQTPVDQRHLIVKKFQEDPKHRVFIGNIQAAGTCFTLTKATRVIFAEFSYVPGENRQAIDRAVRIGQDQIVLAQYLVLKNSVDKSILEAVMRKTKNIEKL